MCLFPFKNLQYKSKAYQYGVQEFECGACPECLSKRARLWALRCCMQAEEQSAVMVTLTYDSYIYDSYGRVIGERVASDMNVNKRDCQLFIKRLRRYMSYHYGCNDIKYLITAEYGKRTHRPHYHAILFGCNFNDVLPYKKSKRGNMIYKSATLDKLWNHGICTLDAVNMNAKIARYCTKYCAKDSRADDTFMLVSRGVGDNNLMKEFNGLSYFIDGREYPIPRGIWNKFIESKYNLFGYSKYKNFDKTVDGSCVCAESKAYFRSARRRELFLYVKHSDFIYKRYIRYWKNKGELYEKRRLSPFQRLLQLPNEKYFAYKQAAFEAMRKRTLLGDDGAVPPRSGCVSRYLRRLFLFVWSQKLPLEKSFAYFPLVINRQMTQYKTKAGKKVDFYLLPEYEITPFDLPDAPKFKKVAF